jgi:hypothetical protein
MTAPADDINVRSPYYYVAQTMTRCWRCGQATRVVALALPSGHETRESDSDTAASSEWQPMDGQAMLFYVDGLNDPVRQRLGSLYPTYHLAANQATRHSYWSNHCEHCDSPLDDHELHCEPGVFSPSDEVEATQIQLLRVDEALEAAAAGYAFQPEFFELMRVS